MGRISWFDPWLGKIPGEGHSNPLQYSCLEKLMVREARWGTVYAIAKKSDTTEQLSTHIEGWYGYSHFQSWCILTSVSLPIFKKPGLNDGEGNSNPLQYSCLENPMNGGAW